MSVPRQLSPKAAEILREIAELGPMRQGSLCRRILKRRTKQGQIRRRGPYWYYTFKKNNRTECKMITEDSEPLFREQIERFRRFQALTREYADLCQGMADLEAKKAGRKKTPGPDRGGKAARGRAHRQATGPTGKTRSRGH